MSTDSSQVPLDDSSTLCIECGFCCTGVLYGRARLLEEEIGLAEQLGLTRYYVNEKLYFTLPCPHHCESGCSIYSSPRPGICSAFRCRLLKQLTDNEITLDAALIIVNKVKQLAPENPAEYGREASNLTIREKLSCLIQNSKALESIEARRAASEYLMKVGAFYAMITKHFYNEDHPVTSAEESE